MSNIDVTQLVTAETLAAKTKAQTVQTIADTRFLYETKGIIWNNYLIATDRDSQSKLAQAQLAVIKGIRTENDGWKCYDIANEATIFRATTNTEMGEIADYGYKYVAECFAREQVLLAAVNDGTYTDSMLTEGWPDTTVKSSE